MNWRSLYLIILLLGAFAWPTKGQSNLKNAKVSEVEAHLTRKSTDYIRGRFPNYPLLINISVVPLRRDQSPLQGLREDTTLPFLVIRERETLDEWDDPTKSVHELIPRISSVNARIALPDIVTDDEIFELRDALYSNLGLIPGRDNIVFERRNWRSTESTAVVGTEWMVFLASLAILFLMGLTWVIRHSARSIEDGLRKDSQASGSESPAAFNASAAFANNGPTGSSDDIRGMGSEIHVNDTLKIAERIEDIIEKLVADPSFPNLQDMMELEELAIEKPGFLGAIIQEMPKEMQDRLFQKSSDNSWLRVFFEHDPLTAEHYHFMLRLSYRKRNPEHQQWNELLIVLWRLKDELAEYMKTLSQRDALGVLAWMPTEISVPTARKAFPGAWGILLRHDFLPSPLPEELTQSLIAKTLEKKPYRDTAMIDHYNHERGLLDYLRVCPMEEERDIYNAAPSDASIHVVRPPFFRVFEADEDLRRALAEQLDIRELALSLFNIDRDIRTKITEFLSAKKRLLLVESLKDFDRRGTTPEQVGIARENIARAFHKLQVKPTEDNSSKPASTAAKPEERNPSGGQAA